MRKTIYTTNSVEQETVRSTSICQILHYKVMNFFLNVGSTKSQYCNGKSTRQCLQYHFKHSRQDDFVKINIKFKTPLLTLLNTNVILMRRIDQVQHTCK